MTDAPDKPNKQGALKFAGRAFGSPELPTVLRRPGYVAHRHLDAADRHELARLQAHRLSSVLSALSPWPRCSSSRRLPGFLSTAGPPPPAHRDESARHDPGSPRPLRLRKPGILLFPERDTLACRDGRLGRRHDDRPSRVQHDHTNRGRRNENEGGSAGDAVCLMAANVVDYGFHTSTIGDDSKTGWEQFPAHQYASVFRLCRSSANRVSSLKRGSEETESLTILQYPTVFALLP